MIPLRVLSLGSVHLDIVCNPFHYDYRLPLLPESIGSDYSVSPGGSAFHAAHALNTAGLPTLLIAKTGTDLFGNLLHQTILERAMPLHLIQDPAHATNLAIRYVKPDTSSIRTMVGSATQSLTYDEIWHSLESYLPPLRYCYLTGVSRLTSLLPSLPMLIRELHARGIQILYDHGPIHPHLADHIQSMLRTLIAEVDYYTSSRDDLLTLWESMTVSEALLKVRSISSCSLAIKDPDEGIIALHGVNTLQDSQTIPSTSYPYFDASLIHAIATGKSFAHSIHDAISHTIHSPFAM